MAHSATFDPSKLTTHEQDVVASCHCRKVRVRVRGVRVGRLWTCTCSICAMRGGHWFYVPQETIEVVSGRGFLQAYLYATRTSKNMFCTNCGVHVYAHSRSMPTHCAVKVECIDGFPPELVDELLCEMDGSNWEEGLRMVRESEGYAP